MLQNYPQLSQPCGRYTGTNNLDSQVKLNLYGTNNLDSQVKLNLYGTNNLDKA